MLCNLCGKHPATLYFKGLIQDQTVKLHLCQNCAKKKGLTFPFGKSIFSLGDMVATLAAAADPTKSIDRAACRHCGLTYGEFQQTSQLGCSECYAAFATLVGPLLKRLQGSSQHVGKTSARTVRVGSPLEQLTRLKSELREAVRREDFEQAAQIRDQISRLEQDMTHTREGARE